LTTAADERIYQGHRCAVCRLRAASAASRDSRPPTAAVGRRRRARVGCVSQD